MFALETRPRFNGHNSWQHDASPFTWKTLRCIEQPKGQEESRDQLTVLHATSQAGFFRALRAVLRAAILAQAEERGKREARTVAWAVLREIIGIATEVFGRPITIKESFDPEYPKEKYVVLIAEVAGDNAAVLKLESEWAKRIAHIAPIGDAFRLIVKRQK